MEGLEPPRTSPRLLLYAVTPAERASTLNEILIRPTDQER